MSAARSLTPMVIKRDMDRWEVHMKAAGLSPETIYLRKRHVQRVFENLQTTPAEVTSDALIDWLGRQEWAPQTRRSYRASLQQFFTWWAKTQNCENKAVDLPRAKAPRSLPRPAQDGDILAALRKSSPRVQLMIELMAYGGLRRGEVSRAKTSDLVGDWLQVTGKGGHVRLVPLPAFLCNRIRNWEHQGWLFPGTTARGHMTPAHVGKLVCAALPDGVTAHKLRHRFATTVYKHSHDIRAVQELLGHAKLDTTMIYVALDEESRRTAAVEAWSLTAA